MVSTSQTQDERKGESFLCTIHKVVKMGLRKRRERGPTKGFKMTDLSQSCGTAQGESQNTSERVKKGPRKIIIKGPAKEIEVTEHINHEYDSSFGQPCDTIQDEREDERQLCIPKKIVRKGPRKRRERSSIDEFQVTQPMHPEYINHEYDSNLGQPCDTTQDEREDERQLCLTNKIVTKVRGKRKERCLTKGFQVTEPMHPECNDLIQPLNTTQVEREGETLLSSPSKDVKSHPAKRRGRGPTKEFEVTEPMHLEYNNLGQPCGRWRDNYGKYIGLCIRKLSILYSWSEVPQSLKNSLWDDTVKLFHIEPDQAKKNVFLSALAERFRCFKSKLVSGWITLKRKRTKCTKMKIKEKENEEGKEKETEEGKENDEAPVLMPYEIYPHITEEEWKEFVARKTTPEEVEKRRKASMNANKKQHFHHLGPKTYEQKRKEWIDSGFYPNLNASSSVASSSSVTTVNIDRALDWWCSLHGRDENGRRTISDPKTKEIADAVIGWKQKEIAGEFTPKANIDALYMVLGKDHNGRVKGQGGVRLGLKKVFGDDYLVTKSKSSIIESLDLEAIKSAIKEELREEMKENFTAILQQMGLPGLQHLHQGTVVPGNRSHQDISIHIDNDIPDPLTPNLEVTAVPPSNLVTAVPPSSSVSALPPSNPATALPPSNPATALPRSNPLPIRHRYARRNKVD